MSSKHRRIDTFNFHANTNEHNRQQTSKLTDIETQATAINTKLDNLSGAVNNNIGDGSVKLQTYAYAHDSAGGLARPLQCDSSGHLKVSNDVLEVSAETINLSTDTLEAKTQAITDKLDTFAGAGNNNIGEGSSKLQTYLYARDVAAGNFKPIVCDGDAHLQVDVLSTALPTGGATEATLAAAEVHLGSIDTTTTAMDIAVGGLRSDLTENGLGGGKKPGVMLESQNANLIAISNKMVGGQTTTGMATAANQQVIDLTIQGLGDVLDDLRKDITEDGLGGGNKIGITNHAINNNIINMNNKIPTKGQKVMSGSVPVVLASNQASLLVNTMGSQDGTTSGTQKQLKVNSSGQLQIDPASVVAVAPSNSFNSDNSSHVNSFAVGIRGRTDITDHSTGKFLLCDSNGRLDVKTSTNRSNGSEVVYVSGQSISGSGTHTGAAIALDPDTNVIFVEHNFSHTGIKYELMASIDGSNFFGTGLEFNAGGLSPATLTGISTILGSNSAVVSHPPHIKFKFSNSDSSAQTATLSYVIQSS